MEDRKSKAWEQKKMWLMDGTVDEGWIDQERWKSKALGYVQTAWKEVQDDF